MSETEDRASSVMSSPSTLPRQLLSDAPTHEDRTHQYRVPPEVLERFLQSKSRKGAPAAPASAVPDSINTRKTAPPAPNAHEEGPFSNEPLPRMSSPRVPSDLFPITPVDDHELSDDEVTVHAADPGLVAEAIANAEREESAIVNVMPVPEHTEVRRADIDRETARPIHQPTPETIAFPSPSRSLDTLQMIVAAVLLVAVGVIAGLSLRGF
jgi:hypothetical protein